MRRSQTPRIAAQGHRTVATVSPEFLVRLTHWTVPYAAASDAEDLLIKRCMVRRDLRYYPASTGAGASQPEPLIYLGPRSMRYRRSRGWNAYGLMRESVSNSSSTGTSRQEKRYLRKLGKSGETAYVNALAGRTEIRVRVLDQGVVEARTGGCITAAETRLYGSRAAAVEVTGISSLIDFVLAPRASHAQTYTTTLHRWQQCMMSRQIKSQSPTDLEEQFIRDYRRQGYSRKLHRLEISAAVADLQCQVKVGLPTAAVDASLQAVRAMPTNTMGEVVKLLAVLQRAALRARHLLADN